MRTLNFMRKRFLIFLFFSILLFPLQGFSRDELTREQNLWVQKTLASMTLDEKIGQLIMPATIAKTPSKKEFDNVISTIKDYSVGGYLFILDSKGLHKSIELKSLTHKMQIESKYPLLMAADFEGGVGFYFEDAVRFPRAMAIGASNRPEFAYQIGQAVAKESKNLGVNVIFYPDVDVNNNPQNPIINIRSFGEDPERVGEMALAYMRGLQAGGMISTAKHFPGHGNADCDSHLSLPIIKANLQELENTELKPFKYLIDNGLTAVMSAHMMLPAIEENELPATLSPKVLNGLLRKKLNFDGLIFTDAMMMNSISKNYPNGKAAVLAIKAGADVVLYPPSVKDAFEALKQAVLKNEILESRVDQSVERILKEKARLFVSKEKNNNTSSEDYSQDAKLSNHVMEEAITLFNDQEKNLPLKLKKNQNLLLVNILENPLTWREGKPAETLKTEITKRHKNTISLDLTDENKLIDFQKVEELAKSSQIVVIAAFVQVSAFKGSIGLTPWQISLIERLSQQKKEVVFLMFGNPYLLTNFPNIKSSVLAYECYPGAEKAVSKALFGEINFHGKAPVKIPTPQ